MTWTKTTIAPHSNEGMIGIRERHVHPSGWVIVKSVRGRRQTRPFERTNRNAPDPFTVFDPDGIVRATGATITNAKANAEHAIVRASE